MTVAVTIACQLCQFAQPGEIANQYDSIVSVQNRTLAAAAKNKDRAAGMQRSLEPLFRALLDRAAQLPQDTFNTKDLIALAESAERVKEKELALGYAQRAVARADDFRAYITVVRCLCAAERLDDAEAIAREASTRFPDAERRYLPHNMLSHKYRGVKRFEDAYRHMILTIEFVLAQVDTHPFYPLHLERCLDEADAMAETTSNNSDLRRQVVKWHATTTARVDRERGKPIRLNDAGEIGLESLKRIGLQSQAANVFSRYTNDDVDTALEKWLDSLIGCEVVVNRRSDWLSQVNWHLEVLSSSMTSSFRGDGIAGRLDQVTAKLAQLASESAAEEKLQTVVDQRLREVGRSLFQHRRHLQLVESHWRGPTLMQMVNGEAASSPLTVIHIFDPLSRFAAQGHRSMEYLQGPARKTPDFPVLYAVFQSGLRFDSETHKLERSESTTLQQELSALKEVGNMLSIPTEVHLLQSDTLEAKTLAPTVFPVTVLVDSYGGLVCALTGTERQKSIDIARQAKRMSEKQ